MTKPSVTVDAARSGGHLEPDAIGVTEDTIIGMAASAPAASVGLTLAALASATAYGSGPIIILIAIPMRRCCRYSGPIRPRPGETLGLTPRSG